MHKIFRKMMTVGVAASLMVTCVTRDARAFGIPLLSYDIPRVAENVQKIMNMIMQVKAEVESHMQIIKQIQHGGFGAAAGMLFAKIENGDYERLFGSFADIGINWKVNKEMSGKRAEMRAQCEKEAEEMAQKANQDATAQCQKDQPTGSIELQKCIDSAGNAAKKVGKKSQKECLKKGYAKLASELTQVRAEMYQAAMARYAEAKAKMKAYTWLQNAGLSTTTFLTDSTIRAIGDGRIGDALATGSSALGRGAVAAGLSSAEGANALGYLGGVAGGITQDMQNGYGIWGKMGIGGSSHSGGSSSSESSEATSTSESSEATSTSESSEATSTSESSEATSTSESSEDENISESSETSSTSEKIDLQTADVSAQLDEVSEDKSDSEPLTLQPIENRDNDVTLTGDNTENSGNADQKQIIPEDSQLTPQPKDDNIAESNSAVQPVDFGLDTIESEVSTETAVEPEKPEPTLEPEVSTEPGIKVDLNSSGTSFNGRSLLRYKN